MRIIRFLKVLIISSIFFGLSANATMVKQMNLGELTDNAENIFRGTIIKVESGSQQIAGANLPTVKYFIRVSDTIKGQVSASTDKKEGLVEITMLGSFKATKTASGLQHHSAFKPPVLTSGKEYLLFTTAPSKTGLSMTVGVGQGKFGFVEGNSVINEASNAGLFRDMNNSSLPNKGPIPYAALVNKVRGLIANKGGR